MSSTRDGEMRGPFRGIYVHIPFCRTKCPYCGFFPVAGRASFHRFFDALELEARRRAGAILGGDPGRGPDTLYVGGGTPSLDEADRVTRLPGMARSLFGLRGDAEVTIEANPDDIVPAALESWLDAGYNRISIGVQSLDDAELRVLGRRHDADAAARAVGAAREAGFGSIGIDLIFGLAGQTADRWRRTLEAALSLSPDHLSCYQLTVERGTPFAAREAAGDPPAAGERRQRDLFLETDRILAGGGFEHYEVSNYARAPEHRS
ncbi:MAG: radical SAM protein, partial [Candidatus Krumholzibacteria bacterium]|nr:radical SAM protein [Candidatus Krumholzibacteria bacterium]